MLKECLFCNETFENALTNSKFCSDVCEQNHEVFKHEGNQEFILNNGDVLCLQLLTKEIHQAFLAPNDYLIITCYGKYETTLDDNIFYKHENKQEHVSSSYSLYLDNITKQLPCNFLNILKEKKERYKPLFIRVYCKLDKIKFKTL